ncbi:hypothetical protein [Gordonia westfalica]|uniref:Uncharacterized protein n=1 Tax=Gordonia westfalica TaxID=158898 RepID=A0A1H2L2F0_9ACTN|nr:hypothetical protein [Gordonia westfalica]SDU74964.1 hypothetical protein SAMN04488548_1344275 [Gordonia westfalica]
MAKVNEATGGRPTAAAIRSEIGSRRIDPEPDIDAEVEAEPVEIAPGFTDAALAELNAPTPTPHRHNRPRRSVGPSQMLSTPRLST